MENELPAATWKDRLLHFLGRRRGFLIEGDSMTPTLNVGDSVFVKPTSKVKPNDIVLARHPYKLSVKIVKRLVEIMPDGALVLRGDNPLESTDSRSFGSISPDRVIGKVVCRLK